MRKLFPALLLAMLVVVGASCQTLPQDSGVQIRLKSRTLLIPEEGVDPVFLDALKRTSLPRLHAFVLLKRPPTPKTQGALATKGVHLLFHVTQGLWAASVDKAFVEDAELSRFARWIESIRPEDKIAPEVLAHRFHPWAVEKDGRIKLAVEFYADVPRVEAEAILKEYAGSMQSPILGNGWYVVIPKEAVRPLAEHDQVKWIEQGPLPFQPLNNFTRDAIHVEEVQEADLGGAAPVYHGLTGAGIRVGVWDEGIDGEHEDFKLHDASGVVTGTRLLTGGAGSDHGTMVAGVIGASGYRSEPCGSLPYIFRGMAPDVEMWGFFYGRFGPAITTIANAVSNGMDLSNHSYVQAPNGSYGMMAQEIDRIVRGSADYLGSPVPPRAMVWAASNNGSRSVYSNVEGYYSVEAPAKNGITVGAVIGNRPYSPNHLASFSSLGPTGDGRIKPEVVAPGDFIQSTEFGTNCYRSDSGTSVAAPAVAGTLALVLQQYARTYGADLDSAPPLPSTLKAALIQTTTDLVHTARDREDWDNPDTGSFVQYHEGPDYATGYGVVNALAAVGLVREKNLAEGQIAARDEVREHVFQVPAGTERIQFTLAWDDEAFEGSVAPETAPRLVNDLELTLVAPDGTVHLPWVLAPLTPAAIIGDPDPIAPSDITPASRGRDHLNNVEQVTVVRPAAGRWIARVEVAATSPGLLARPQSYSLAGDFDSRLYFTDWAEQPGKLYEIHDGAPRAIFTAARGRVYHSAFAPDGTLYVTDANTASVLRVRVDGTAEVVYRHLTYVRDLAFDPGGQLYFSEASGARADGKIYRLDVVSGTATTFYPVRLGQVGGFWAGDFAFDRDGRLYLSSGNRVGGRIYRVDDPAARSLPVSVYSLSGEAVTGIAFNRRGELFFTNWNSQRGNIYRASLADGRRDLVYSFSNRRIWDISFR